MAPTTPSSSTHSVIRPRKLLDPIATRLAIAAPILDPDRSTDNDSEIRNIPRPASPRIGPQGASLQSPRCVTSTPHRATDKTKHEAPPPHLRAIGPTTHALHCRPTERMTRR